MTTDLGWSRGVKVRRDGMDDDVTDVVRLPASFRPHAGWEFVLVSGWELRRLARMSSDQGWGGVAAPYTVRVNGKPIEQKFVFVGRHANGRQVAHEIGHTRQPLGSDRDSPRKRLTDEIGAWSWSVERRGRLGADEYNDFAHILDDYRDRFGFSPKVVVKEAKVVMNRLGRRLPDHVWRVIARWLLEEQEDEGRARSAEKSGGA